MTHAQVSNLAVRQIKKLNEKSIALILNKKKASNSLLKQILLNSTDKQLLDAVLNEFLLMAKNGNIQAKKIVTMVAYEKFNPNSNSRTRILGLFKELAQKGDLVGLEGMLLAAKSKRNYDRYLALEAMGVLAGKGEGKVLPGLMSCVNDSLKQNRFLALRGLVDLSNRGNKEAIKGLIIGMKDSNPDRSNATFAKHAVESLAKQKNKEAIKALKELGG